MWTGFPVHLQEADTLHGAESEPLARWPKRQGLWKAAAVMGVAEVGVGSASVKTVRSWDVLLADDS